METATPPNPKKTDASCAAKGWASQVSGGGGGFWWCWKACSLLALTVGGGSLFSGFDCRCGNLFCGIHRYSDKHNCPYDYKADAAAKIRKENPVVVADKIQRI